MSSHVNSCHGDYPFIYHIVSSGVHFVAIFPLFLILSAQVCTCVVLSSHETPCQVMTNHVKSCHGDYPLISHIVSSGVHFVAIFPSFLILSAQVCTCAVIDTTFFNMNLDSSSTPLNSDSGCCLFF